MSLPPHRSAGIPVYQSQTFQAAAPCHVPKHSGSPHGPAGLEARDTAGLETCATSRGRRSAHQVHRLDSRPILEVFPNCDRAVFNRFRDGIG